MFYNTFGKIHINVSTKLTGITGGTGIFQRQLQ